MPKDPDRLAAEQARAEAVYRPDPAETTPAYREAWSRGLPRWPLETRMPDNPDRHEPALSRVMRERGDALRDPAAFERARAEALADEVGYDRDTALAVLRGMETPPRRPAGHVEDVADPAWVALPPEERAAALEAEAAQGEETRRFEALVARVMASGSCVDLSRDVEPPPVRKPGVEDIVATVRLRADGELVVSAPGAPPTRIVAVRAKRARAAAQRVAELVEEAIVVRERREREG